jgi:hemerythrin-like domain-containing protein
VLFAEGRTDPPEDVTTWFARDHELLDGLRLALVRVGCAGRYGEARELFDVYEARLRRHLRLEEDVVFPVFEARSGLLDGPTSALRADHRDIRRAVEMMGAALRGADEAAFRQAAAFLGEAAASHTSREDHILFPTTDQLLTPSERARLVARLQED